MTGKGENKGKVDSKEEKKHGDKTVGKEESFSVKFAKRNIGDAVDDARARYLARKKARAPVAVHTNDDDD